MPFEANLQLAVAFEFDLSCQRAERLWPKRSIFHDPFHSVPFCSIPYFFTLQGNHQGKMLNLGIL